ncbi:MAG: hypothetical protein ACXWYS_02880, partial [Gaiellaceae bacterium]
ERCPCSGWTAGATGVGSGCGGTSRAARVARLRGAAGFAGEGFDVARATGVADLADFSTVLASAAEWNLMLASR